MIRVRSCGSCAACCIVPPVEELKKPPHVACRHLVGDGADINRCGVFGKGERPPLCTKYNCLWLDGSFTELDRPDRLGVIFEAHLGERSQAVIVAREVEAGAALGARAKALIERCAAQYKVRLEVKPL